MQFILIGHDKAGALQLRMATRAAHLAYWAQSGPKLIFGGPMLDAEGKPTGSVLVVEAEEEAQARLLFDADPYIAAGLFAKVSISAFRQVFANGVQI